MPVSQMKSGAATSICILTIILAACTDRSNEVSTQCTESRQSTRTYEAVTRASLGTQCNGAGYIEAKFGHLQDFIYIPAGSFAMGSPDGLPDQRIVHDVQLDDYWIAKYPVTVAQFAAFIADTKYITDAERGWGSWQWNGRKAGPNDEDDAWRPMKDGRWNNIYFAQGDDHPVGSVSWNDANAYAVWLSEMLQISFLLPTEAQWEKAARGNDGRWFPWGNSMPDGTLVNLADRQFANKYGASARRPDNGIDDGYIETSPVDAFPAGQSPYGVFDMAGNLGEWVFDIYDPDYYQISPASNPLGPQRQADLPDQEIDRVNRGGSWVDWSGLNSIGEVAPQGGHNVLAAARTGDEQNSSDDHMGFRLAIDLSRSAIVKPADPDMPDLTGVTIVTHPINERLFMLEATGDVAGNVAVLVSDDGVMIVDDQFAELTPQLEAAIALISANRLKYILNTHHHSDHSDGNARLSAKSNAVIVAHDRTRRRLLGTGPGNWPVITFDNELTMYFGNEEVRLISIPGGHTDNDTIVWFSSSNAVHLGDLMNSGISSFPLADSSAGGNALTMLDNVAVLLNLVPDGAKIIPGHGPLTDKSELFQLHKMLEETIDHVQRGKHAGLSLDSLIAAGLPPQYADWGTGYMNADGWIANIYESIGE